MAKKSKGREEDEKPRKSIQWIDNIPKYKQRPRSPAPKRRTDFSSLSNQDSLLGSSRGKDGLSAATTSSSEDREDGEKKLKELSLLQSCKNHMKEVGFSNAKPVSQHALPDPSTDGSDQHDQLSEKVASSTSSRTEGDFLEKGRGKKDRKRKIHLDEVTFPPKSEKKTFPLKSENIRRHKIMRYLGLAAPIGSPF